MGSSRDCNHSSLITRLDYFGPRRAMLLCAMLARSPASSLRWGLQTRGVGEAVRASCRLSLTPPPHPPTSPPSPTSVANRVQVPSPPLDGRDLSQLPDGLLLVDKPSDWTSSDVVVKIRGTLERLFRSAGHKFKARKRLKVGHGGTLDPMATGLLVVGVGKGCRELEAYSRGRKSYVVGAQLGAETDTQDSTGEIIATSGFDRVTIEALRDAATSLTGDIMQRPPIYSALHKDGVRMHELARAGKIEEKDMKERPVTVYELLIDRFDPKTGTFIISASCGGGTYMRSLIVDLARKVDSTAHMTSLRRTVQGRFSIDYLGQGELMPITVDEFDDPIRLLNGLEETSGFLQRPAPES